MAGKSPAMTLDICASYFAPSFAAGASLAGGAGFLLLLGRLLLRGLRLVDGLLQGGEAAPSAPRSAGWRRPASADGRRRVLKSSSAGNRHCSAGNWCAAPWSFRRCRSRYRAHPAPQHGRREASRAPRARRRRKRSGRTSKSSRKSLTDWRCARSRSICCERTARGRRYHTETSFAR